MYTFLLSLVAVVCYVQALITLPLWAGLAIIGASMVAGYGMSRKAKRGN